VSPPAFEKVADGKCPKCSTVLERRQNQFHWRGRFFHGLVCVPCNALWDDPEDSFHTYVLGPNPPKELYE